MCVETLASLARRYADLLDGRFDAILDAWRARAPGSRGARVTWQAPDGPRTGVTAGIDDRGALLVRVGDRVERIVAGELEWLLNVHHGARRTWYRADSFASMLLAIDVGNTNIVLGVFDGPTLVASWRLLTLRERTADEIGLMVTGLFAHHRLDVGAIDAVVMGSVVPVLTTIVRGMVKRYVGRDALVVDPILNAGMPILYERPAEVGADRIANSIAAYEQYGRRLGLPLIVADLGTATTFDAVTAKGEYLGGVICPGPQIAADALFQRAARLPRVDVRKPPTVIGRTTVGAIESGLFYGYLGMVEGLMRRMTDELGGRVTAIATGGLAPLIAPETTVFDAVEPDITLHGLRIIWERNVK